MKFIKNILGTIWAIWGLLVFTATMCITIWIVLFSYLVKEPLGAEIFRRLCKVWMTTWLACLGCRIVVRGRNHFRKGQIYIVTCNHRSLIDIPLSTPFIPGPNKTIAKKSMSRIPFFGWVYARGSVLVDRNSDASRRKSFEAMKQTLRMGMHMCIYPEGTRNKTARPLNKFYDGAFKLATDTKTPVIPAVIFNTAKVLPPTKGLFMAPHRIEIHFLNEISSEGKHTSDLRQEVFTIMEEYYIRNSKD